MTIWPPPDEMMHARLWDFIILRAEETICWRGSGCLSLVCSRCPCFYDNLEHCHKADLDHYTHLSADQRCSPQFQGEVRWYEKAVLSVNLFLSDGQTFTFRSFSVAEFLCLDVVDKSLGFSWSCCSLIPGSEAAKSSLMTLSAKHKKLKDPEEIFTADVSPPASF